MAKKLSSILFTLSINFYSFCQSPTIADSIITEYIQQVYKPTRSAKVYFNVDSIKLFANNNFNKVIKVNSYPRKIKKRDKYLKIIRCDTLINDTFTIVKLKLEALIFISKSKKSGESFWIFDDYIYFTIFYYRETGNVCQIFWNLDDKCIYKSSN